MGRACDSPKRGAMPPNTTGDNHTLPSPSRTGVGPHPRCKAPLPRCRRGGPVPPHACPPRGGGWGEGGAAPRGPTPTAARRGGRRRSPHLIVHGWAQQRSGPRSLARSRRGGLTLAGRRGGGLFPSSASPPLRAKPLSVPPHPPSPPPRPPPPPPRSRPLTAPPPPLASLCVTHRQQPRHPPPPPAPAPRNRKPTPAEKHPPAANSRTASRLEAGFPPGRRRPPPSPPDRQPLRPIGGGRVAKEAGAGVGTALGQAGSGRRGGWWEGVRPRRLSCPPPSPLPPRRARRFSALLPCGVAGLGPTPRSRVPFLGLSPGPPGRCSTAANRTPGPSAWALLCALAAAPTRPFSLPRPTLPRRWRQRISPVY